MTTTFDVTRYQDKGTIQKLLHNTKTIAIVGLSSNVLRASYFVGAYLQSHGYRIIPVNPRESEVLGEASYETLLDVPVEVDMVNALELLQPCLLLLRRRWRLKHLVYGVNLQ